MVRGVQGVLEAAAAQRAGSAGARRATERYAILDTPPEAAFDRLTHMAARLFDVPMAVVAIAHGDREFFKARLGIALTEVEREQSFCAHLLGRGEVMVVTDARADPRFAGKALVTGETAIRFYAGVPLTTNDGFNIGSICIADTVPRDLAPADRRLLADLAAIAMDEMELRHHGAREAADLNERFQLASRATSDAIWDWDLVTNALIWNDAVEVLFGYAKPDLGPTVQWWIDRVHPEDVDRIKRGIYAVIDGGGRGWKDEYRFRRADGSWAQVLDRGFVMRDADGKSVRMIGAMTDVTDRKRADRAQGAVLRIAQAAGTAPTLQDLLRSIHQIIAELMPADNFYIALLRPGTQIIDFPYLVDQRDLDKKPRNVGRGLTGYVLRTGEPLLLNGEEQYDAMVRSGEVERIGPASNSWVGVPLKAQDRTVGVLVAQSYTEGLHYGEREKELLQFVSTQVAHAIERKQADESLAESERRSRALIENSSDGVAILSPEGKFLFRSPSALRILGHAGDAPATDISASVHPDDRASFEAKWREVLAHPGVLIPTVSRARHQNGSWRVLESLLVNLIGDPAVRGVVSNFRDVTERKQIEAQLMAADRMVSVGTLAAGVAHEINNPLAYVIANLAFAIEALHGSQDVKARESVEALREAQQGAERVRQIVRDLKAFSRTDDAPAGPVDVHQVVDASINMAWNEIRHRARLVKDYRRDLPRALGNEARLGQIFLNLIVNAAQAIPEGDAERNEIRISTSASGSTVTIAVKDTGSGIPPEHLPRLFDPFFTTKPVGVGTGLGLFICQGIVRSLGGDLTVVSEVGKGSVFNVILPVSFERPPQPAAPPPPQPAPAARGRILAIDDEPLVGAVLTRALSAHEVVSLTSAAEALARIRAGEKFDLVFCDLMMPHMTGMDFYVALESEAPEVARQVIFLTGGAFTQGARDFLERTAAPTVDKPFDLKTMRALVAGRLLNRR